MFCQLATDAQLNNPHSVAISSSDQVYISEIRGQRIRKIDRNGIISTVAGTGEPGYNGDGQLAVNAKLCFPCALFVNEDEEVLFCDRNSHRVRKIDKNGIITTIAGNGNGGFNGDGQLATSALLNHPSSVFQYKNEVYIVDCLNHRIRKIDQNGTISTIAGTRNDIYPWAIHVHNDEVYFTDDRNLVCKIQHNGIIQTIAGIEHEREFNGDDKLATECKINNPQSIFIDNDSQIYIADTNNQCIRKIDQNGMMRRVIGSGAFGYSGDVPFDFHQYPHIGPRKKPKIKPFPQAYHDLNVIYSEDMEP